MAFELDEADDGGDEGAPKWMTTFGDAITLLVTFFVLLLTYSSPNKRDLQRMSSGFLGKGGGPGAMRMRGASPVKVPKSDLSNSKQTLSRTQFPPLYEKLSKEAESQETEGMDVSKLPTIENAIIVRLALKSVFGDDGNFTEKGEKMIKKIASVLVPFPRVVVVRTKPEDTGKNGMRSSFALSQRVIDKLKKLLPSEEFEFRVSSDIALSPKRLEAGQCEIFMLQQ